MSGDMVLRVLDLLWSLIVQTAWIWLPAGTAGFVLGYAWKECPCAPARKTEHDVNGVEIDGP